MHINVYNLKDKKQNDSILYFHCGICSLREVCKNTCHFSDFFEQKLGTMVLAIDKSQHVINYHISATNEKFKNPDNKSDLDIFYEVVRLANDKFKKTYPAAQIKKHNEENGQKLLIKKRNHIQSLTKQY